MKNKLDVYLRSIFITSVVIYTCISMVYFLGKPYGSGDESVFIDDLNLIDAQGWITAIKKGISIPYMLLVYPASKILGAGLALRLINISLFGFLILYFRKVRNIQLLTFYTLLLFFFSSIGYFMVGTSDTLFIIAMTIFISETHFTLIKKTTHPSYLWGLSLVVALFTREMFLLFVPVVLLAALLLLRFNQLKFRSLLPAALVTLVLLAFNYPSILSKGQLSFDVKSPPEGVSVTWSQRQYLAQLWVNEGKIKNYSHPTWKETQAYVDQFGEESLPATIFDGMFHNPILTVKEFVKDGAYILGYSIRLMGLTVLIVFAVGLVTLGRRRLELRNSFILLTTIAMFAIFSLVIISFVELRWLSPVFLSAIVYFHLLNIQGKIPAVWSRVNYLSIVLLAIYGSYGFLKNLI